MEHFIQWKEMQNFILVYKWLGQIINIAIAYYYITVPRTCMEYKSKGSFQSGTYLIDPIQKKGSSSKFSVFCDFENGKFIQYIKL